MKAIHDMKLGDQVIDRRIENSIIRRNYALTISAIIALIPLVISLIK